MKKMGAAISVLLSETNVKVQEVCEHVGIFKCLQDSKRMLTNLELS